jgi:hypothetical protein
MKSVVVALALVVSTVGFAQCSTLTVTGSVNPGQTVTVAVTGGAENALVYVVAGDPGQTTFSFGALGSLTLAIENLHLVFPLGMSDSSGDVSLSFEVPAGIPAGSLPDETFTLQAVSAELSFGAGPPSLEFCTSNTATLVVGNG